MIAYVVLTVTNLVTAVVLYRSIMRGMSLMDKIEEVEEFIESSYDRLDECHRTFEEKCKVEVFSDEPIVKELVSEMKDAKETLKTILDSIQEYSKETKEGSMDEDEEKSGGG